MKKLFIYWLLFLLSACSNNIKSKWTCPVLEGGKGSCISIAEADEVITDDLKLTRAVETSDSGTIGNQNISENRSSVAPTTNSQKQLRTEEKIGRIWFAPFVDSDGNHHGESLIYVVDEEARWIRGGQ